MKRHAEPVERPAILAAMAEARGHIGEALALLFGNGKAYGNSVAERRRRGADRKRFGRAVVALGMGPELRKLYPRLRAWAGSGRKKGTKR